MDPWDAFPDDWDAFPDAPGTEQPRAPKALPAGPKQQAPRVPVRPGGGMPPPDLPRQAKALSESLRPAEPVKVPNPAVTVQEGDYELKLDRIFDFSPPSTAMTNIQQRQYLQLVNDPSVEAGRVLQQFRMAADSRAVRREVLSAFVRGGGGKDDLQEAANALLDAVEMGPGVFNTLAEQVAKPKFRDKISELYINSLLSNPPTHIVNMVSNSLTMISQIPEYAVASALGGATLFDQGR